MNKDKKQMTAIYVCSPFRPTSSDLNMRECELDNNIDRVHQACRLISALGYMPLAPHGYFTCFLNDEDPEEREDGLNLAMEWLALSDELWIFGNRISEGMAAEIAAAADWGIPVRCMPEPSKMVTDIMTAIKNDEEKDAQLREMGAYDFLFDSGKGEKDR